MPPGSEFGPDFFKYVLGPVGETLTNFAQTALPTTSGVPSVLGIPGVTTPGLTGGGYVPGAGPDPGSLLPIGGQVRGVGGSLWGAADANAQKAAAQQKAATAAPTYDASTQPRATTGTGYARNVQTYMAQIKQAAADTGVPERVLASIVDIECPACDPNTVRSDTRAAGLGQVVGGPTDPLENLRAAGRLLREKQKVFGIGPDDWASTAAAYFGAYRPGVGITADRDATGTNGFAYVDKFNQAYGKYPDNLGGVTTGPVTEQTRAQVGGPDSTTIAAKRPTQFDPWLSPAEQIAACGPAVVAGLAGVSVREALDRSKQMGQWDPEQGMHGPQAEASVLESYGLHTSVQGFNNQQIQVALSQGQPVVISAGYVSPQQPGHYYLVDGFNPANGRYHVGTSGTDLKGGSDWMTPAEMSRMGPLSGVIYIQK